MLRRALWQVKIRNCICSSSSFQPQTCSYPPNSPRIPGQYRGAACLSTHHLKALEHEHGEKEAHQKHQRAHRLFGHSAPPAQRICPGPRLLPGRPDPAGPLRLCMPTIHPRHPANAARLLEPTFTWLSAANGSCRGWATFLERNNLSRRWRAPRPRTWRETARRLPSGCCCPGSGARHAWQSRHLGPAALPAAACRAGRKGHQRRSGAPGPPDYPASQANRRGMGQSAEAAPGRAAPCRQLAGTGFEATAARLGGRLRQVAGRWLSER